MTSGSNSGDICNGIFRDGLLGKTPPYPTNIHDLEALAKEQLPPELYAYVADGAGNNTTLRDDRRAFGRWKIIPRMMRDITTRDHSIELFNDHLKAPILLAPIACQDAVHPEGEVAVARAAAAVGVPMVLSTVSGKSMEEVGDTPRWFQLYWPKDNAVTKSFLQRAEDAGYSALVVTIDTKSTGWRESDIAHAYLPHLRQKGIGNFLSDPVIRAALDEAPEDNFRAACAHIFAVHRDLTQEWDDLAFLRDNTNLPIVLKGILHPDDAREAVAQGMDGIIVSTHGGRQVDGSIAALDALPPIVEAVGDKMPVLFDSGIRHGADIMKAIALGARAVLLGRPYIWGLAVGGEDGVRQVLEFLLADYDINMAQSGLTTTAQLGPDILRRADE
jgi:lactate 2-monooxygenase